MSLDAAGPRIAARRMETINVGTVGHIDIAPPYYWWQHPTRMSIAIRLGITRLLLERRE